MGTLEAIYIFDEHNNTILQHIYNGRPPSAKVILTQYLNRPAPRPSLIYVTDTNPATLLFSVLNDKLLYIATSSAEIEPLAVLEFLHRVTDALEEFLGSPLLASKVEDSYDVVAQLLGEMCDAGIIAATEPNALRDVVEAPSWMGKLLSGVALPGSSPALGSAPRNYPTHVPLAKQSTTNNGSSISWRRSNVRHTSNELYVDIVESLLVTIAPSGRLIAAFAHGTIVFNCKVSGIPDLVLTTSAPGGRASMAKAVEHPVFHPCVRLARWRERPGELSFIPPDGRFVLASYEVNLLPENSFDAEENTNPNVQIPAIVELRTCLGPQGTEFEAELTISSQFRKSLTSSSSRNSGGGASGLGARISATSTALSGSGGGTSAQPQLEKVNVSVPISSVVRNITNIRSTKGEARFSPGDCTIEWTIASKDIGALANVGKATLRCTVVGQVDEDDQIDNNIASNGHSLHSDTYDYTDDQSYQATKSSATEILDDENVQKSQIRAIKQNALLMPISATVSFTVKGWLASGIKVDSLVIDTKASKGLGAGVTPYKGVKYLTLSQKGVEVRC